MIPRHFSRPQVVGIVSLLILFFYYFRKDINKYFDQIDVYSTAHPELWQGFTTAVMIGIVGFLGFLGVYIAYLWKIDPWRHRRREIKRLTTWLAENRPQMNLLENNMQSCSIMFANVAEEKNRIYLLGYRRQRHV